MSALAIVMPRPSGQEEHAPTDDVLDLGQLLDLFTADDDGTGPALPPDPFRRAVSEAGADLAVRVREQLQEWSERAAGWGSGPQGAWRAW